MQVPSIISRGWKEELPGTTEKFVSQNGETKEEWLFIPSSDAMTESLL